MTDDSHPEPEETAPEDPEGAVVPLFPGISEPAVKTKGSGWRACKHPGIDLDMEARQALCRKCKEAVSAFDWLAEHVGDPFSRMWRNYQDTKAALVRTSAKLDDLERRVRNARSQVKRWEQKATEAAAKCDKPVMPCD